MALVTLAGVTKQFGSRVVLDGLDLEIPFGAAMGLVGPNGCGKTTLFRLIVGAIDPDHGSIVKARSARIGYLTQEPGLDWNRTLREEISSAAPELLSLQSRMQELAEQMAQSPDNPGAAEAMARYDQTHAAFEAAGGHRFEIGLKECLGGLGFSPSDYDKPLSAMSGGQRCRAALAKVLVRDHSLLLLDEPTNHLDIDAVGWLEKYLAGYGGGVVIISHDRYLLDRVCRTIVEIDGGRARTYPGNYTNYVQARNTRVLTQTRQYEKDQDFIRKERAFIARHLAGQRTNEAKGRRTRLERRLAADEFLTQAPQSARRVNLRFAEQATRPGTVLRCDELGLAFGSHRLFEGLTFQVAAGDRLGIVGPNGTGKTTLLRMIARELAPQQGSVWFDPGRTKGLHAQDAAFPCTDETVLGYVRAAQPELGEERARTVLGAFRFSGDEVFKPLGLLSGGEQSRVRLACLCLSSPEVLLLDEPTNHMDIPSREVLEEALASHGGTVIVVSHDRYFLDRAVNRLLILQHGTARIHPGNYSDYVVTLERESAVEKPKPRQVAKPPGQAETQGDSGARRTAKFDKLSVQQIEERIMDYEVTLSQLHERFGDLEVYKDPARLADLQDESKRIEDELELLNEAWAERIDEG